MMMVQYFGRKIDVPDYMIDDYTEKFSVLAKDNMQTEIEVLRDSIFNIMELIDLAPDLLEESKYYNEFVHTLVMKEALFNNNILHNA
jgi:hypothetical protein